MRIEIEIPKEFEEHFNQDRFKDSLERIMADIKHSLENRDCLCAGRYEHETIEMLEKAFENSRPAYDVDKVVEELKELPKCSTWNHNSDNIDRNKAIEIVKQGSVTDDVCEWKTEHIVVGMRSYMPSCCDKEIDMPVSTAREMIYCPYCGKKIKEMESE